MALHNGIGMNKKIVISTLLIISLLLSVLRPLDKYATQYIDENIVSALLTYGAARSINAGISVVKEIEFSISVGAGVTASPGAALDPLDDLIERFSWVVMMAITSLGIQKLLLTIVGSQLATLILALVSFLYLIFLWKRKGAPATLLTQCVCVVLFTRFALVFVLLTNYVIEQAFIDESKQQSIQNIQMSPIANDYSNITSEQENKIQEDGILDSLKRKFDAVSDSVASKMESIKLLTEAVTDALEDILHLIAIFILQTIILPIALLWALYKATLILFRSFRAKEKEKELISHSL